MWLKSSPLSLRQFARPVWSWHFLCTHTTVGGYCHWRSHWWCTEKRCRIGTNSNRCVLNVQKCDDENLACGNNWKMWALIIVRSNANTTVSNLLQQSLYRVVARRCAYEIEYYRNTFIFILTVETNRWPSDTGGGQ